ncbi:hypothetical protein [Actinomadura sp. NPDC000929]
MLDRHAAVRFLRRPLLGIEADLGDDAPELSPDVPSVELRAGSGRER